MYLLASLSTIEGACIFVNADEIEMQLLNLNQSITPQVHQSTIG